MRNTINRHFSSIAVAMLFVLVSPTAIAQKATPPSVATADPLQIKLTRSKIVLDNGREVTQNAEVAKPGDVLEEVATYTNTSKGSLKNLEATLPIPANTELVMSSMTPANAKASTDGRNFAKTPLVRKVKKANGVEIEEPIPLSEYRYLRWYPGELAPNKPMVFSARFKVANTPAPTANATK